MTLLDMIHSLRERIDKQGSLVKNATLTRLINDAGSEILEGANWSFDVRHDGAMWFPRAETGTNGTFGAVSAWENGNIVNLLFAGDDDAGEIFSTANKINNAGSRMVHPLRSHVVPAGDNYSNTSWAISDIAYSATELTLTLVNELQTAGATGVAWTIYANELVLPSTVRQVLSVRNEEQDIPIQFIDREVTFDSIIPRVHTYSSNSPEVIYIGGSVTSTSMSGTWPSSFANVASATGIGAMIWPIPTLTSHLHYSYRVQHSDLALASDFWVNVPNDINRLIVDRAVQIAFETNIADDNNKGLLAGKQADKRLARAMATYSTQPNIRRIPTDFRDQSRVGNTRRRWASQTIPSA